MAALATVCILVLCSSTVFFGQWTQESGGYKITLLGSIAGKNISDFILNADGTVTYVVYKPKIK